MLFFLFLFLEVVGLGNVPLLLFRYIMEMVHFVFVFLTFWMTDRKYKLNTSSGMCCVIEVWFYISDVYSFVDL